MSETTVLVIDDSTTIRRLVDSELSTDGYRVVLAPNAEDGIQRAAEEKPDLILLDHQLPGTTGYDVCCQLLQNEDLKQIPVVISSTLRKKAYAEYTELTNVVDMLPKPYTADLLRTTVRNALDTASMIVQSQSAGTAVPEVIDEFTEAELAGSFATFGLRELLDFLNNSSKCGMLEIDAGRSRICLYLDKGRIQAITGSGFNVELVSDCLPPSLGDLAPMVKFTVGGRNCSEVDGLVELLDNKVLDARLLRQLLRHQAAVLIKLCLQQTLKSFRFESDRVAPSLFRKLPLDISLLALLVEAAQLFSETEIEGETEAVMWIRSPIRGQNLDRAGLSGKDMKLLGLVAKPSGITDLQEQTQRDVLEIRRTLLGFEMAGMVTKQDRSKLKSVVAIVNDIDKAQRLTGFLQAHEHLSGRVVRDVLAVRLLLRRSPPDLLLVDLDDKQSVQVAIDLQKNHQDQLASVTWTGVTTNTDVQAPEYFTSVVQWPEHDHELGDLFECKENEADEPSSEHAKDQTEMVDCL